jgi:hypothetical protein
VGDVRMLFKKLLKIFRITTIGPADWRPVDHSSVSHRP